MYTDTSVQKALAVLVKEKYLGTTEYGFGSLGKWETDGEICERDQGHHFIGSVTLEAV